MRHRFLMLIMLVAAPAALAQSSQIALQNVWARATAPNAGAGGVFLTLTDNGAADRLVGVSTPAADMAEVHETINDNGVMKMRPVIGGVALPTGTAVTLKPGGYHIMLMGLKRQLRPGDTFPITLDFEKAAPVTVTVKVGAAGAMGPMP